MFTLTHTFLMCDFNCCNQMQFFPDFFQSFQSAVILKSFMLLEKVICLNTKNWKCLQQFPVSFFLIPEAFPPPATCSEAVLTTSLY